MDTIQLSEKDEFVADQRKFERYFVRVSVFLECLRLKRKKRLNLVTMNISAGGAYVNTPISFPEGSEVKMAIFLSEKDQKASPVITVTGQVLRSEPNGMAFSFNDDYEITATEVSTPPFPCSFFACQEEMNEEGPAI